jgi:ribosomal protein L37E
VNLIDTITCQRCAEDAEPYCTHRDLCAECAWSCPECQIEWAESETYDADRDEL